MGPREVLATLEQARRERAGGGGRTDLALEPLEGRRQLLALRLVGRDALEQPLDLLLLEAEPLGVVRRPLVQVLVLRPQADGGVLEPVLLRLESLAQAMTLVQPRL